MSSNTASAQDPYSSSKVALFITSSKPFGEEWLQTLCETAERAAEINDGSNDCSLEHVEGNFLGWTPFELARDYVFSHFFERRSDFAYRAFAMLDDKSHEDQQVVIVALDHESFLGKPLGILGTMRTEAEM